MRIARCLAVAAVVFASTSLSAQSVADSAIVLRGAPVPAGPAKSITEIAAAPTAWTARPVIVEGVIAEECTEKGCWMQVVPAPDAAGMRVTFKDYGFFIPQSMVGRRARMQGVTKVVTHSKADADHLIGEGAKLQRNADGTATEVQFIASGVELRR